MSIDAGVAKVGSGSFPATYHEGNLPHPPDGESAKKQASETPRQGVETDRVRVPETDQGRIASQTEARQFEQAGQANLPTTPEAPCTKRKLLGHGNVALIAGATVGAAAAMVTVPLAYVAIKQSNAKPPQPQFIVMPQTPSRLQEQG